MKRSSTLHTRYLPMLRGLLILLIAPRWLSSEPKPEAVFAFNRYVLAAEARMVNEHRLPGDFNGERRQDQLRLRHGDLIVQRLGPGENGDLPGALLHHWRGSAFAPGAAAVDLERLLKDFDAYPKLFSPQVLAAKVTGREGTHTQAWMRVRQKHVITVVMDGTWDVSFGTNGPHAGSSTSRSTRIYEIDSPGTPREHALSAAEEHGFLWRLNSYWTYEEGDGGLYITIESISLSRSIPAGLAWAVRPFVESVPRESLEFTLRSACNAIRKAPNTSPRRTP